MEHITIKREIDLIDCYRLAVDFGWPAAEKAINILNTSLSECKDTAFIEDAEQINQAI